MYNYSIDIDRRSFKSNNLNQDRFILPRNRWHEVNKTYLLIR